MRKVHKDETCWCCGEDAHEMHHVIPKRAGGSDADHNLLALCTQCHNMVDRVKLASWPIQEYLGSFSAFDGASGHLARRLMLKALANGFAAEAGVAWGKQVTHEAAGMSVLTPDTKQHEDPFA